LLLLLLQGTKDGGKDSGLAAYVASLIDRSLSWEDLKWLRSITTLPIVVKGVMCAEDAKEALKHGVDAIWVSNHGARQLDTAPSTIEALPEIIAAVQVSRALVVVCCSCQSALVPAAVASFVLVGLLDSAFVTPCVQSIASVV
jgi:FMN-dependent dehydrogenase